MVFFQCTTNERVELMRWGCMSARVKIIGKHAYMRSRVVVVVASSHRHHKINRENMSRAVPNHSPPACNLHIIHEKHRTLLYLLYILILEQKLHLINFGWSGGGGGGCSLCYQRIICSVLAQKVETGNMLIYINVTSHISTLQLNVYNNMEKKMGRLRAYITYKLRGKRSQK